MRTQRCVRRLAALLCGLVCALGISTSFAIPANAASAPTPAPPEHFSPSIIDKDGMKFLSPDISGEWKTTLEAGNVDTTNSDFLRGYNSVISEINESAAVVPLYDIFSYRFRGDGCTYSPDRWGAANFRPACDHHDSCYSSKSHTNRSVCDSHFHDRLDKICAATYAKNAVKRNACYGVSAGYYAAVRALGWKYYEGKGKND